MPLPHRRRAAPRTPAVPCRTWEAPPSTEYRILSLPPTRWQVLGAALNRSESIRRPTVSVYRASQAGRACLERAGRSQPANGRLRYVEAPCHVSLRFAKAAESLPVAGGLLGHSAAQI